MAEDRLNPEMLLKEIKSEEEQKLRGKLKIFFGYSAGVGKTYTMLQDAHALLEAGVDVVIGYVEPHQRPATLALFEGLPKIPPMQIKYKDITLYELDVDSALKRHPKVILVDELAHTNASGCRHAKRYQDVEELLKAGIDVYTTVNVQHIEGLHDTVEAITGVAVRERVPDNVFNNADKVELVDIEPEDLINRLSEGKIYKETQAKRALVSFFTKENLVALREISLRRTADRVNISVEKNKATSLHSDYVTDEHILMCLSSSPSNAKVVRTAAKIAQAFRGTLTAIFVETDDFKEMSEDNKSRLRENLHLAEQLGAKIVTVYGEDAPHQVAEYAKTSGVSKIVVGHPVTKTILGFTPQNFIDKLNAYAPNLEIFVIPNTFKTSPKKDNNFKIKPPILSVADTLKTLMCLAVATLISFWFDSLGFSEANIITTYVLASLFTAVVTEGKIYSIISSLLAVMMFNYFFTDPRFSLQVYNAGYPITFLITFLSAFITSTFTKRVKVEAKRSMLTAHRTEVLLETSKELSLARDRNEIFSECITQVNKLLDKKVVLYPVKGKMLGDAMVLDRTDSETYVSQEEFAVASWVYKNNKHAGATTNTLSGAKCLYMAIRTGETVFAVIGIALKSNEEIAAFEKSLLIAMLSEFALALEKESIIDAKNEIILQANREQLRSNLLRAISHDLRTPLTGIAGGSGLLIKSLETLDNDTIKAMLSDIESDALWLSNLVENLLNMTRIQDGKLTIAKKPEMIDEIISVAISKVIKRSTGKKITINEQNKAIFVPMDAGLIIQVLINLLDNALKHTKEGTEVKINYKNVNGEFSLSVIDNGDGIPPEKLDEVFEPFYTSDKSNLDKQRGMGLGLSICKSIIEAHGGSISCSNNGESGATFKITLPMDV